MQIDYAQFEEQGYLRLGKLLTDSELSALQARIDDIMLGRIRYEGMFFQLDSDTGKYEDVKPAGYAGPTLNYRKIETLEKDDLFLAYMQHPVFEEITRRYVGPSVSVFRAMFMNKPAGKGTVLPYHQDGGTQWRLTTHPLLTTWTALDPATKANGCVEIIPGSHRLGLLSEHGHTITPEQEAEYAKEEDAVFLEAEPGEVILLHNFLLHRSGVNKTDIPRRAFSVCYMDAVTRRTDDPYYGFAVIFGEGALVPGWAKPVEEGAKA